MLRTRNWGKEAKFGDVILWWTLVEALAWRQKYSPISIEEASNELSVVLSSKHAKRGGRWLVWASGIQAGWPPTKGWHSGKLPPYRPLEDPNHPPVHDPEAYPIPAEEWPDLVLSDIATGKFDYAHERTPAWRDVQFPRDELIQVWLPLITTASGTVPSVSDAMEEERKTSIRRGEYESDLEAFMTYPNRRVRLESMTVEGVAGQYLQYHERRRAASQDVPRLPGESNRKRDVSNMVKKIRNRLGAD